MCACTPVCMCESAHMCLILGLVMKPSQQPGTNKVMNLRGEPITTNLLHQQNS